MRAIEERTEYLTPRFKIVQQLIEQTAEEYSIWPLALWSRLHDHHHQSIQPSCSFVSHIFWPIVNYYSPHSLELLLFTE